MSKQALIEIISKQQNLTKKDADGVVSAFVTAIEEAVKIGQEITLIGFGKFEVIDQKEKQGRNPSTGEAMTIAAKKVVKFKVGSRLKEMANA